MNLKEMIEKYDLRADEINKTGFLKREDWVAICNVIDKYNCKKIMEFGTGTSTRLFTDCGLSCVSYEQDEKMLKKIKSDCPDSEIHLWDGRPGSIIKHVRYDLIFIDGPWCVPKTIFSSRQIAFEVAKKMQPKLVAMHDMHFKSELKLRNSIFKAWPLVESSELTHICRNPKWK